MSLSGLTIRALAEMICGTHGDPQGFSWPNFPYRSSGKLTEFFYEYCRLPYKHNGGTRITWVVTTLSEINADDNLGIPSENLTRVINELLESVRVQSPDKHQGAIDDVNKALSRDKLQIKYVNDQYNLSKIDGTNRIVESTELGKCLDDFAYYISADQRMTFWRFNNSDKKYEWIHSPESYAKQLLLTFLNGRFGQSIFVVEEIKAGAGKIDVFITSTLGDKVIVELKMCGHGYTEGYARDGMEQITHYMENKKTEMGYLIVFDSRANNFAQGFTLAESVNGKTILTRIADVRPYVKKKDIPSGV